MTDSPAGPTTESADTSKETVIYAPAHLEKIRDMYITGSPIALPAVLEEERDELDAKRAAFGKSQGSTPASGVATLTTSSTNAGSTAAPKSPSTTTSATPAGTAGSSTAAQS